MIYDKVYCPVTYNFMLLRNGIDLFLQSCSFVLLTSEVDAHHTCILKVSSFGI